MSRSLLILGAGAALILGCGCEDAGRRRGDQMADDRGLGRDGGRSTEAGAGGDRGAAACQTTEKVEAYAPASGAAAGWVEDLTPPGGPGVESAYTDGDITGIIDGHQQPYEGKTDGFVREFYTKGNYELTLQLWEVKTAADARTLFESNKEKEEVGAGLTFEEIPNAPERAVIANDNPYWRVLGYKCDYTYEINASFPDPSVAGQAKGDVVAFVQYLSSFLP